MKLEICIKQAGEECKEQNGSALMAELESGNKVEMFGLCQEGIIRAGQVNGQGKGVVMRCMEEAIKPMAQNHGTEWNTVHGISI